MHEVFISDPSGWTEEIDVIVHGKGGIVVIEAKCWSGWIDAAGDMWFQRRRDRAGKPFSRANPMGQLARKVAVVRSVAIGVPVRGLVVFPNGTKVSGLTAGAPVVTLSQLSAHLCFGPNDVNLDAVNVAWSEIAHSQRRRNKRLMQARLTPKARRSVYDKLILWINRA